MISKEVGVLRLNKLPRKSLFKVVADIEDDSVSLSSDSLYGLSSTMTDARKPFIVDEVVIVGDPPGTYAHRWHTPIRLPRESAKKIEVFRVR